MSANNPRLFEQGDRYDDDGSHEYNSRSLWTDLTLRDLAALVFSAAYLGMATKRCTREFIHKCAFEHADIWLAERDRRENAR